jgi:oligoendopeptidase F
MMKGMLMLTNLPATHEEFAKLSWAEIEPFAQALLERPLTGETADEWLRDWTSLARQIDETNTRLEVGTTLDTTDELLNQRYLANLENVITPWRAAEQKLKEKLLASGLEPAGMKIPLRAIRAEAALFREANLPLFNEEDRLNTEYDRIIGAQTVMWEGEEKTLTQLTPYLESHDRALREHAFRLAADRRLQDRPALNDLWLKFLDVRQQIATNADQPDYRAYKWIEMKRLDYMPEDAQRFHAAIEEVVVPAARRLLEHRRQQMGVDVLRPWDADWRMTIDPLNRPPLTPFKDGDELTAKSTAMFRCVDPKFGDYLDIMNRDNMLDLVNRKGKAPGGYQTYFAVAQRPFIFMNATGSHGDVQTMLHEGGHAFHSFESMHLPYYQQGDISMEIAEVASMSMELLAAPYLTAEHGGFYVSQADADRAFTDHLTGLIRFWGYMAVVDGFQHWVYTHIDAAHDIAQCDAKWVELWKRFMPVEDWAGFEDSLNGYWQRQGHIYGNPFYYIEYGLAQLGAVQVWRNSLSDHKGAVAAYRRALSLGATKTLPELFAAAGAKFALDAATLREVVPLIEDTINRLEG